MIETDLRLTKDGVLITHHDNTFKPWEAIKKLRNAKGYQVLRFEDVVKITAAGLHLKYTSTISFLYDLPYTGHTICKVDTSPVQ